MGQEPKECDPYPVRTHARGVLFLSFCLCISISPVPPSLPLQNMKKDAICKLQRRFSPGIGTSWGFMAPGTYENRYLLFRLFSLQYS